MALVPFAITGTAGRLLLMRRPRARALAVASQLLQIPIVFHPAVTWKFIAGLIASVTLNQGGIGLYAGLEATWFVGVGSSDFAPAIGLNLAPLVVIVLLARARTSSASDAQEMVAASRPAV